MSELEIQNKKGQTRMKVHDDGSITYFDEHGEEVSPQDYYLILLKERKEKSKDEDNI